MSTTQQFISCQSARQISLDLTRDSYTYHELIDIHSMYFSFNVVHRIIKLVNIYRCNSRFGRTLFALGWFFIGILSTIQIQTYNGKCSQDLFDLMPPSSFYHCTAFLLRSCYYYIMQMHFCIQRSCIFLSFRQYESYEMFSILRFSLSNMIRGFSSVVSIDQ